MTETSSALPVAHVVLRVLRWLNWFNGAAILGLLVATLVARDWTFTALGIAPGSGIARVIVPLQMIAALGVACVVISEVILRRLLAMVETVRDGEPFVAANAQRLFEIAWALLSLQLIGLVIAALGRWASTPAQPIDMDVGFSVNGWIAVLMTFILARVFAAGTRLRDELEGTV